MQNIARAWVKPKKKGTIASSVCGITLIAGTVLVYVIQILMIMKNVPMIRIVQIGSKVPLVMPDTSLNNAANRSPSAIDWIILTRVT
jgi:hypothetical protein